MNHIMNYKELVNVRLAPLIQYAINSILGFNFNVV